jgi:hypothetical protein
MAFASEWLRERSLFPSLIPEVPHKNTGIIIVIPTYDEPDIAGVLDSLAGCEKPECTAEVLIIVNAPGDATGASLENNRRTIENILSWKKINADVFFRLFYADLGQPVIKKWGVGLARKAGMDEALRRFDLIDNPAGVIVNLDGDCTVERGYFRALEKELLNAPERKACSIFFEHPVDDLQINKNTRIPALSYEIHMRYFNTALRFAGYPNVHHTVGSSIALKALPYMKSGGMNRRQAGEDFYFVQKLIPLGGFFNLNSTTIYPSPRASFRVPFGTGASVGKLLKNRQADFYTYNPSAFDDLKEFFALAGQFFSADRDELPGMIIPESMEKYLSECNWISRIEEIRNNTSGFAGFRKRFFEWFNMFRIVKYMNTVHPDPFRKVPSDEAARQILSMTGHVNIPYEKMELLVYLRDIERLC